jgi:hypothetical protein
MAEENEHIKKLRAALEKAVEQRRIVADSLAETFRRGHTEETWDAFISIQNTIEAIARAITHERVLASPGDDPKTSPNPIGFGGKSGASRSDNRG